MIGAELVLGGGKRETDVNEEVEGEGAGMEGEIEDREVED